MEIQLNSGVVLQHAEAYRGLAAQELLLRVDAHVEMIEKKIIIGAIWTILAAQYVSARRASLCLRACRSFLHRGWADELRRFWRTLGRKRRRASKQQCYQNHRS